MSKGVVAIVGILLLVAAGLYLMNPSATGSPETAQQLVEEFGTHLKNVSLLAPEGELAASMQREYGDLVTPQLISLWLADPQNAPGRLTSSPWPDRINVSGVESVGETFRVQGEIVEVSSEGGGIGESPAESARRPITLTVERTIDGWRITAVTLGAYPGDGEWTQAPANSQGVSFMYPAELSTTYISAAEWPPLVERTVNAYSCTEGPITDADGPLKTQTKRMVDDREYCVTESSEGAAGSVYNAYEYAFQFGTSTYRVVFQLQFPQCMNYDQPQQAACVAEQATFDIDGLVDRIAQSIKSQ
jgi:hypothetical protein